MPRVRTGAALTATGRTCDRRCRAKPLCWRLVPDGWQDDQHTQVRIEAERQLDSEVDRVACAESGTGTDAYLADPVWEAVVLDDHDVAIGCAEHLLHDRAADAALTDGAVPSEERSDRLPHVARRCWRRSRSRGRCRPPWTVRRREAHDRRHVSPRRPGSACAVWLRPSAMGTDAKRIPDVDALPPATSSSSMS